MYQYARVGKSESLSGGPGRQQDCSHGGALSDADRSYVGPNELHSIVDGHARGNGTAGTVYIQRDVAIGILCFEKEQLGDNQIGYGVVDRSADEDYIVLEQTRVNVKGALASGSLLYNHWNQRPSGLIGYGVSISFHTNIILILGRVR